MAKYTGRPLTELRKAVTSTFTGEELEHFNKNMNKAEDTGPGLFGKVGLLAQAAAVNAKDKLTSIGTDMTVAIVRQQIANKQKSAIEKEMAMANLDILRKNNRISQEEYDEALEEIMDDK